MSHRQLPEWEPGFEAVARPEPSSPVLAFVEGRLLVVDDDPVVLPTVSSLGDAADSTRLWAIGRLGGERVFALALSGVPSGASTTGLRELLAEAPAPIAAAAGRAAQVAEWELGHAFCGRCGSTTVEHETETARVCPSCGAHYYPRIAPAVIMSVERDGRLLLARRAKPRRSFFSVLAGFVEPGETLEETVQREVREEVGIEVDHIRYFASQPWPFPSQLMIGFTARHAAGELSIGDAELAEADWYAPDDLPPIPGPFTIARRLIDDFVARSR
jgi:NAD+ diphosphatase